jgi:hypothetical protein
MKVETAHFACTLDVSDPGQLRFMGSMSFRVERSDFI